jgi:hypothetical protein
VFQERMTFLETRGFKIKKMMIGPMKTGQMDFDEIDIVLGIRMV